MKALLLILPLALTACTPVITIQTDEAIRLRAEKAELIQHLNQCGQAYYDLKQECPRL